MNESIRLKDVNVTVDVDLFSGEYYIFIHDIEPKVFKEILKLKGQFRAKEDSTNIRTRTTFFKGDKK